MNKISGEYTTGTVRIDGEKLSPWPSQKVWNHSPDGFMWGYGGSGPAQLALALLLKYGVESSLAVYHHQAFKRDVIAKLPEHNFVIFSTVVTDWIAANIKKGAE